MYIQVAAHRGNVTARDGSRIPENTMSAYLSAYEIGVDNIEIDLHMTKDGEIIIMHDGTLDRTTDMTGKISEMTLEEIRRADAGIKCGEKFKGEKVPTFREFLEMTKRDDKMTFNLEFKDYFKSPVFDDPSNDFAKECADKIIAMVEEYGIADRCYVNSFNGILLYYIEKKYGGKYRLHGFYPYSIIGADVNIPESRPENLYCACLFNIDRPNYVKPEGPVNAPEDFDALRADGVQPWVGAGIRSKEDILKAAEYGAMLFTSNEPLYVMQVLEEAGYRNRD